MSGLSRRLPDPPEKVVQRSVKNVLRDLSFKVWDTSQPFRAAITPGLPDLIAIGHGRILYIECKSEMGRLTRAQRMFRDAVKENGGEYVVARSGADIVEWWNARK